MVVSRSLAKSGALRSGFAGRSSLPVFRRLHNWRAPTAKGHLSHVYRKLEIARRGQLANALTDLLHDGGEDLSATATIS